MPRGKKNADRPEPTTDDPNARYGRIKFRVDILEAVPNPMFTEAQRNTVRFLRYYESGKPAKVACAHCGHKKSVLWTMLCSFKVADFKNSFGPILRPGDKVYPPLTAVCQTHLMVAEMDIVDKDGNIIPPDEPSQGQSNASQPAEG